MLSVDPLSLLIVPNYSFQRASICCLSVDQVDIDKLLVWGFDRRCRLIHQYY